MPLIPRDPSLESTLALLLDPYGFIGKRCRRFGTDLFQARLLFQNTLCLTGREAAELFYDRDRFVREGALPIKVKLTLFGQGTVHGLDDETHRGRKQLFMGQMSPEHVRQLGEAVEREWEAGLRRWAGQERVILYREVQEFHCRAVCAWAGVPLPDTEVPRRTRDFAALFDQGTLAGPGHWAARRARKRVDRWAEGLIRQVREGRLQAPEGTAAHAVATHREADGQLLPARTAGVELINFLRPTVAVSVYVTFAALALHQHPECRARLQTGDPAYLEWFVQEVRRFYPFIPTTVARVRRDFDWHGYRFPRGWRVLLDVYGTDHDPRLWDEPNTLRPERFRNRPPDPFDFIPQGGGDPHLGHRCPGEAITLELLKVAVEQLTQRMTYEVPPQDLRLNMARLPPLPRSRFRLRAIHPRP